MILKSIKDPAFSQYGKVISGLDVTELMAEMEHTPLPDGVVYEPSVEALEALAVCAQIRDVCYGGMPIQIGYCNGDNHQLNALEYHRDSEVNLACTDLILLIGREQDIDWTNFTYETQKVEAFLVPKGSLVEVYATTLHYAPVSAGERFRCVVVLPKGTNAPLPFPMAKTGEAKLLTHVNKWLIAHPDAHIANAHPGLIGENLTL